MATPYSIAITMSQDTVTSLLKEGYSLYASKGVQTTMKGGAPLVWFSTQKFSQTTTVAWTEQYQGYTSQSSMIPTGTVTAGAAYDMSLGSTLTITDAAGDGTVTTGGTGNAISILNGTTSPFPSSGISQVNPDTNKATPLCAFPLHGGGLNVFAPKELVLLAFATLAVDTGKVIFQSFAPAALFDLTSENELSVGYDIDKGWLTADPNIKLYQAGTDLAPLLLVPSASLSRRALASFSPQKAAAPRG
jgi:hypothetical protein